MSESLFKINIPPSVRFLPRDYEGYVVISDIDKTYLVTQIESLGGLIRAALEAPERKENVPGFAILLRALRRGAEAEPSKTPIVFLSASPPQMRQKLLAKMELDGVEHNGIILKNQMQHVRNAEFKRLTEQIGYKLSALLCLWAELPPKCKLILFGDDSEKDPVIFSIFGEILSRNIYGQKLYQLLTYLNVYREDALKISWFSRSIKSSENPVRAVFINMVSGNNPHHYRKLSPDFYPTENTLQSAFVLFEHGLIRSRAVKSIAKDLVYHHDHDPLELLETLVEGEKRSYYSKDTLHMLCSLLAKESLLPDRLKMEQEQASSLEGFKPRDWFRNPHPQKTLYEFKLQYTDDF
jgi:hypothetical protein